MVRAGTEPAARAPVANGGRSTFLLLVNVAVLVCILSPARAGADTISFDPAAVPSDAFTFAKIDWLLLGGSEGIAPNPTTIEFDTTADVFTAFSVEWNVTTFDLLQGGVYQSVNVLPHGPAEFYNALFTGGTWEIQRDSELLYYLILQPSYGDGIDTGYVSEPLIRPETTTLAFGTFTASPAPVPEPSTFALLLAGFIGCAVSLRKRRHTGMGPVRNRAPESTR